MEKVRDSTLFLLCMLAIAACVTVIPGLIYLVIHFAPVRVPFVEAHLALKVFVIFQGVTGGILLVYWVVQALLCWVRDSD